MKFPGPQNTAWMSARFTDDEFEDLIGELSRIGRFELRDYEIYRVNGRQGPDASAGRGFRPAEFTDDEFENLIDALGPIGRFELRDWKLFRMNAQNTPHLRAKTRLFKAIDRAIETAGLSLEALVDGSVRFGDGFAPDPDIIVWRPSPARKAVPGGRVELIAEVSDSTVEDDLGSKRRRYALSGLREYWVADINAGVIHLFAEPKEGAHTRAGQAKFGDRIASLTIPDLIADTASLVNL